MLYVACMCIVYISIFRCIHLCMCVESRRGHWISCSIILYSLTLRQSFTEPGDRLAGSKPQQSLSSPSPQHSFRPGFLHGFWGSGHCPLVCTASILTHILSHLSSPQCTFIFQINFKDRIRHKKLKMRERFTIFLLVISNFWIMYILNKLFTFILL